MKKISMSSVAVFFLTAGAMIFLALIFSLEDNFEFVSILCACSAVVFCLVGLSCMKQADKKKVSGAKKTSTAKKKTKGKGGK